MTLDKTLRIGEILLNAGIIDRLQLNTALKYQREWDRKLGEALVELGFISEGVLVKVLSKFLKVPSIDLSQVRVNPLALQKVPKRLAEKHSVFPVDVEGKEPALKLLIAMTDPTNLNAIDEIAFTSGCRIKPVVAAHSDIDKAIRRHYGEDRVVDIFFSLNAESMSDKPPGNLLVDPDDHSFSKGIRENPPAPGPVIDINPGEDESMVIMRQGVETVLNLGEGRRALPSNLPESPLGRELSPSLLSAGNHLESTADWGELNEICESVHPSLLLRALLKAFMSKGLISMSEFQEALSSISDTESGS